MPNCQLNPIKYYVLNIDTILFIQLPHIDQAIPDWLLAAWLGLSAVSWMGLGLVARLGEEACLCSLTCDPLASMSIYEHSRLQVKHTSFHRLASLEGRKSSSIFQVLFAVGFTFCLFFRRFGLLPCLLFCRISATGPRSRHVFCSQDCSCLHRRGALLANLSFRPF